MLKRKLILLSLCLFLSPLYGNDDEQFSKIFSQPPAQVIFDYCSALYGIVYGGYQLCRFIKESIAYGQKNVVLQGDSEEELSLGPLNELCQSCMAEKSSDQLSYLYGLPAIKDLNEWQKANYRLAILHYFNMYQFPVFRKIIQQWPEYPIHLLSTAWLLKHSKEFHKKLAHMQGFKKEELCAYIKEELCRLKLDENEAHYMLMGTDSIGKDDTKNAETNATQD